MSEFVMVKRELLDVLRFWLERSNERSDVDIPELKELRAVLAQEATPEALETEALKRAWQAGYDTAHYGNNPAHKRTVAQEAGRNQCGKCGAETVQACNDKGCYFFESGNGGPTQHPILKVLSDPQAMELVALKATVAQQAQMIEWMKKPSDSFATQEPIYQFSVNASSQSWTDVTKEVFEEYESRGGWSTRIVYAQKAPVAVVYPSVDQAMKLVMNYQENIRTNVTGTTNWAANLGMHIIDKVKELNQ